MLDFEVDGKQYEIQHHHFTNGKLCLVVNDRISETLTKINAVDYKCDFLHVLATYIHSKKFCGGMEWAHKHFKKVRRLFCRLERVYGSTSSASICKAKSPLAKMPEMNRHKKLVHARQK